MSASVRSRPAAVLLAAAGIEAAVAAVGAFMPEVYDGLVPSHYIAESRGQDLVTLFLAVPVLVAMGMKPWRDRLMASILSAGALLYVGYVSIIYAYGGVANGLYFGYVAGLALAVFGTWRVWSVADLETLGPERIARLPIKSVSAFLWVASALLVVIWGGMGVAAIQAEAPAEANTILVTDLALVIPAFVLAGR